MKVAELEEQKIELAVSGSSARPGRDIQMSSHRLADVLTPRPCGKQPIAARTLLHRDHCSWPDRDPFQHFLQVALAARREEKS